MRCSLPQIASHSCPYPMLPIRGKSTSIRRFLTLSLSATPLSSSDALINSVTCSLAFALVSIARPEKLIRIITNGRVELWVENANALDEHQIDGVRLALE